LKSSNLSTGLNVITEHSIPEEHDKVTTSLRTAYASELTFDKKTNSNNELLATTFAEYIEF